MDLSTKMRKKYYSSFGYKENKLSDKVFSKEELYTIIINIREYYQKPCQDESVLKYIKGRTVMSYDRISDGIKLLIMAGILNVEFDANGQSIYLFAEEAMEEVESICAKEKNKGELVK